MKKVFLALTILLFQIACHTKNESPNYTILRAVDLYTGKGKCGEILMPSISREMKSSDREKLLRDILKKEGWVIVSAYSSSEAYNEKSCASLPMRTKAFKDGYIGKIDENGAFSD